MRTSIILLGLALTGTANAGTIGDCYDDAETNNSGLNMVVKLGTTTQLSTSDPALFFDKVAELHESSNLNITYNTAGEAAIEESMQCIFDANLVTLSAIWVNENDANVRLHDHSAIITRDSVAYEMDFDEIGVPCGGTVTDAMVFSDGTNSSSIEVVTLGNNDWKGQLDGLVLLCAKLTGTCNGQCKGIVDPGPNESPCGCVDGTGTCKPYWGPDDLTYSSTGDGIVTN